MTVICSKKYRQYQDQMIAKAYHQKITFCYQLKREENIGKNIVDRISISTLFCVQQCIPAGSTSKVDIICTVNPTQSGTDLASSHLREAGTRFVFVIWETEQPPIEIMNVVQIKFKRLLH
ncbi:hypothetical protein ILYODFUR_009533 [Ilyodon furcidens]|uniref:Uncharacterized protein n=1 Tax=Ilyodon furcidens TaxID=33524 RepID=A0ABV0SJU2_9TELE